MKIRISLSIFLAGLLLLGGIIEETAAENRPIAALKSVSGMVKIVRNDGNRAQAVPGNLLYTGESMFTSDNSSAVLLFTDGSQLKVGENTDITISGQRESDGQLNASVKLPLGNLWAKVTRRETRFEVETPSSVASVKGTEFAVIVNPDSVSKLFVYNGVVSFANQAGTVTVRENQTSIAAPGQPPAEPQKMNKEEREQGKDQSNAKWKLDIRQALNNVTAGQVYRIQLVATDIETGEVDPRCDARIEVSSTTPGVKFSLDGITWQEELNARFSDESINIYGLAERVGEAEISIQGEECQPVSRNITVTEGGGISEWEREFVANILSKLGIPGLEGRPYLGGELMEGYGSYESILRKLETGELEIIDYEIEELPDGSIRVIFDIR